MIRITKDKRFMISRGDTAIVPCYFKNVKTAPEDGTIAVVSLKRDYNDKSLIWKKQYYILDGRFYLKLNRDDTRNLLNDVSYYYDIQLKYRDGQVFTLIPPTEFKVLGVVADVNV